MTTQNPKTHAFPLTGSINLAVQLGHGTLTVDAREDLTEATVTLAAREPEVLERFKVELRGSTLTVSGPHQRGLSDLLGSWRKERHAVDLTVVVPAGTAAKLETATAPITVTGRIGPAVVSTAHASIELATVTGDLRLMYGNGESRVDAVTGSVQLKAGRADAQFGRILGSITSGLGSGSLAATEVRGDLHARAGSGSTSVDAAYGNIDLATGAGSLTVGIPDGVSVRLDVATGAGRLLSDLPVEDAPKSGSRPVKLRARTGKGDVHLVRAPAA